MTPQEHRAEAERLLGIASETYAAVTRRIDGGAIEDPEQLRTDLLEIGVMAQLSQAHTLLSSEPPPS